MWYFLGRECPGILQLEDKPCHLGLIVVCSHSSSSFLTWVSSPHHEEISERKIDSVGTAGCSMTSLEAMHSKVSNDPQLPFSPSKNREASKPSVQTVKSAISVSKGRLNPWHKDVYRFGNGIIQLASKGDLKAIYTRRSYALSRDYNTTRSERTGRAISIKGCTFRAQTQLYRVITREFKLLGNYQPRFREQRGEHPTANAGTFTIVEWNIPNQSECPIASRNGTT